MPLNKTLRLDDSEMMTRTMQAETTNDTSKQFYVTCLNKLSSNELTLDS